MAWVFTAAKLLLAVYGLYILAAGILPYLRPPRLSREAKGRLNATDFLGGAGAEPSDWAYVAESGQESLARRIELVRAAQLALDITVYTIKPGETGEVFFAEVLAAADRGVRVRLLLSGKTNKLRHHKAVFAALRGHKCVQLREFNPFHPLKPWAWQVMMHDKIILADGRGVSLGGRNYGDEYCDPPGYCGPVTHDREVFVLGVDENSAVRAVLRYFEALWGHRATRVIPRKAGTGKAEKKALLQQAAAWEKQNPAFCGVQKPLGQMVVPTKRVTLVTNPITLGPKQPWVGWQMQRLAAMGREVLLQTPYMTDNPHLLAALKEVAAGRRLRILTNSCLSSPNLPAFSVYLAARKRFLAAGAELHEYTGESASIHGKSLLVDDALCAVGSFNMDDRSLFIDTETMLVVHGEQFNTHLREHMEALLAQSVKVTPDNRYPEDAQGKLAPPGKRRLFRFAAPLFRLIRFLV